MKFFCDMDGVLCDFDYTAHQILGNQIKDNWVTNEQLVEIGTEEFWANLPWTPFGKALWAKISPFNPFLLSAYNKKIMRQTINGKLTWIEQEIPTLPAAQIRLVVREDKQRFAKELDGTPNILIDDYPQNISEWNNAGGFGYLINPQDNPETILKTIDRIIELNIGYEPVQAIAKRI